MLSQFSESTNFLGFLAAFLVISNEIEQCYLDMSHLADIDAMQGYNLDVIGIIVGASRYVSGVVTLKWFGFEDTGIYATVFGEESDHSIGSRFFEEGEVLSSTTIVNDVEYRLIIKAKIVKNNGHGTPEDVLTGLRYIFGTPDVQVTDNYDMSFSIAVGRPVLAFEQALISSLDILPRPAGVRIAGAVTSYIPPGTDYVGSTMIESE